MVVIFRSKEIDFKNFIENLDDLHFKIIGARAFIFGVTVWRNIGIGWFGRS